MQNLQRGMIPILFMCNYVVKIYVEEKKKPLPAGTYYVEEGGSECSSSNQTFGSNFLERRPILGGGAPEKLFLHYHL